jgi:hypothetical protein
MRMLLFSNDRQELLLQTLHQIGLFVSLYIQGVARNTKPTY